MQHGFEFICWEKSLFCVSKSTNLGCNYSPTFVGVFFSIQKTMILTRHFIANVVGCTHSCLALYISFLWIFLHKLGFHTKLPHWLAQKSKFELKLKKHQNQTAVFQIFEVGWFKFLSYRWKINQKSVLIKEICRDLSAESIRPQACRHKRVMHLSVFVFTPRFE